jgi:hypothetical protein
MSRHLSHRGNLAALLFVAILIIVGIRPAQAGVTLILDGEDDHFVGGGRRLFFTSADGSFIFSAYLFEEFNHVFVSFSSTVGQHSWHLWFGAPGGQRLTAGTYTGATGLGGYHSPNPLLDIGGDGRGCSGTGSFEVRDISVGLDDTVESLSIAFEHHCDGKAPALFGEIRLNPFITVTSPRVQSARIGKTLDFAVSATDDLNGRSVQLSALDLPPGAVFTDRGDNTGIFTWTPSDGQEGLFDVTFEARSDSGYVEHAVTRIDAAHDSVIIAPDLGFTADLFPDHPGASWTYRLGTSRKTLTISVLNEKKVINGIETSVFRDDDNYREYYTADADGLRWHGARYPNGRMITFEPPLRVANAVMRLWDSVTTDGLVRMTGVVGGRSVNVVTPYSANMWQPTRTDNITVPAGSFEVVRVGGNLTIGGEFGQIFFYLAPGIGVIRSVTADNIDIFDLQLVRTNVALFTISALTLSDGERGVAYSSSLDIEPPDWPYTVKIISGSLPAGLSMDARGLITGVPARQTTSTKFTVEVSDRGSYVTRTFGIKIFAAVKITSSAPKKGISGRSYTATLKAGGGKAPYNWSLASGSLPPGLVLNSATGVINGTPAQSGVFPATFRVTDSLGGFAEKSFSFVVK